MESAQYEWVVTHDLMLTARFLPLTEVTDEVIQYDPKKLDPHPVFMIENGGTTAYLTAKTGERLQTWNFDSKLGNDLKMLSDGSLLVICIPEALPANTRPMSPSARCSMDSLSTSEIA